MDQEVGYFGPMTPNAPSAKYWAPLLKVKIAGRDGIPLPTPITALIETGAEICMLDESLVSRLQLEAVEDPGAGITGHGFNQIQNVRDRRTGRLSPVL